MQKNILDEMRKFDHDDDRRYQLLLRYLRLVDLEKKQRGFLRRLKRKWQAHLSHPTPPKRK
ncbi:hypothetical protein [Cohnella cellulosilytica]|uniref:Uncharacterized protein n=1 Tax=Cohnella cellulosilytica TaxID=986710 RepID=A0ABW2FGI6_9BACL